MKANPAPPVGGWKRIYVGAWLAYAALVATAMIANDVAPQLALRNAVANVLPDALAGVAVLLVAARKDWIGERHGRLLAVHLASFVVFTAAATIGWQALWWLDRGLFDGDWVPRLDLRFLPWRVVTDALLYGTLAAAGFAWCHAAERRELADLAARAEASRARAELEALRSQLNPHFLLNTLHALVGLVRRDPATAEEALERLGDLLRHSLRIQRRRIDELPLRDECALVQGYLELERLRLGERLHASFDLADEALDESVPSFALQTLVENAVRHGISARAAGGRLAILARRGGGRLRIEVENDAPAQGAPADEGRGGGLDLLRERLAALYDGGAQLALERGGERFRARLELPLRGLEER